MLNHYHLYHGEIPAILEACMRTSVVRRLQSVGMNCGCEYTSFLRFRALSPYSRYAHSVGVALIVWHFTRDPAQATAGLLHDIATPVFAHVVDFMRGDYLAQESTEDGTEALTFKSPGIAEDLRGRRWPARGSTFRTRTATPCRGSPRCFGARWTAVSCARRICIPPSRR